jgi:hypothetical protein
MPNKIKILYLAANPIDTGHLRLQEEARDLKERIRLGPHREAFEVIHYLAVRPRDILRGLQEVQPHILHFSGHGDSEKGIVLQDEQGISRPIAPQDLADLVRLFQTNLKLALLIACYGLAQASALHQLLDFTVGMNKPISDSGAVSFSAAFYQVLAGGGSVKQAFEGARVLTSMEGRPVFEKSDLLIREGANVDKPFVELLPVLDLDPPNPPTRGNHATTTIRDSQVGTALTLAGNNNDIKVN